MIARHTRQAVGALLTLCGPAPRLAILPRRAAVGALVLILNGRSLPLGNVDVTETEDVTDAVLYQQAKTVFGTTLDSAEIKALGADIYNRAVVSAGVDEIGYLDAIYGTVTDILTGNLDHATARLQLQAIDQALGVGQTTARQDLILETSVNTARGYGQFVRSQDPDILDQWPAQELFRLEDRREPRDWPTRWEAAGGEFFGGRMIARVDSDVWQALGNGAGGFTDTLGNRFPPYAFRSGMWTELVARHEAIELGVIEDGDTVEPLTIPSFNEGVSITFQARNQQLQQDLLARAGAGAEIRNGAVVLQ